MIGVFALKAELNPDGETADMSVPPTLPPCDTGCTEAKLGLLNIEPKGDIWELLRVTFLFISYRKHTPNEVIIDLCNTDWVCVVHRCR